MTDHTSRRGVDGATRRRVKALLVDKLKTNGNGMVDEIRTLLDRAERAEAENTELRARVAELDETIQTLTNLVSQPTEVPRLHLELLASEARAERAEAAAERWRKAYETAALERTE